MNSHLTPRSGIPTAGTTDRASKPATCRGKHANTKRSAHKPTRTTVHATKDEGATMDYQQGFTSGPSS